MAESVDLLAFAAAGLHKNLRGAAWPRRQARGTAAPRKPRAGTTGSTTQPAANRRDAPAKGPAAARPAFHEPDHDDEPGDDSNQAQRDVNRRERSERHSPNHGSLLPSFITLPAPPPIGACRPAAGSAECCSIAGQISR